MRLERALFGLALLACACPAGSLQSPSNTARRPKPASTSATPVLKPASAGLDAGLADREAADGEAADARVAEPAACQPPVPVDFEACRALLESDAPGQAAKSCDDGFRPKNTRFVHCTPDDLLCVIRQQAWDHAPIYHAASGPSAVACLQECQSGNGASCMRAAKSFGRADGDRATPATACAAHFAREACRLGLPYACQDEPECPEQALSKKQAFQKLQSACDGKAASWECFYVAHSREMVWGAGVTKDVKSFFRQVCAARCPPVPARCYKQMACDVVRLYR